MDKHNSLSAERSQRLTEVEGTVQRTLKPVPAPPAFRAHLRDGLMMAAQHQQAHRDLGYAYAQRPGIQTRWWIVGAAILGSIVGFIAIQLYNRNTQQKAV